MVQNILVLGCLTLVFAISAFVLWGPSPRSKKKKGHIVGLVNLGSTCFLNTLLQALASCALFLHWLSQQKQDKNSLTSTLHRILWVLNGSGTGDVYDPVEVLSALKRHGYKISSGEQDAHELFNVIVLTLQDESNKALKAGSLSDALYSSDSLLQGSDVVDNPKVLSTEIDTGSKIGCEEILGNDDSVRVKRNFKKLKLGQGDDSPKVILPVDNSSSDTINNYEDASDKLNHGDSISHSSTVVFNPLEEETASPNIVKHCGDVEESSPEHTFKLKKSDENEAALNSAKNCLNQVKTSQESFKKKSSDFSGFYDRISGSSPCVPQAGSPPFQGLLTSTLQCSECGHHSSIRCDTFDSVSLPLVDSFQYPPQKLQDLLYKFVKTEIIPEVECEKCCKKTTAFKTLNFGKLPQCLCLRIARTAWHTFSRTPTKREDFIDFPEYLPMDDYTVSARIKRGIIIKSQNPDFSDYLNSKEKNYKHLYKLKSVVVHLGGVNSGHFLTYRRGALNTSKRHRVGKLAGACMDSQRWYLTSDDNVKMSTLCEAMDSIAYMLFYEKCYCEPTSDNNSSQSTHKNV